mmetsp:Transcript_31631/g.64391  ORF Transcript_31631/g.64391 Transcript_31631/m.64391 type:complete len:141 (+) Transcript_31631:222-644(+)
MPSSPISVPHSWSTGPNTTENYSPHCRPTREQRQCNGGGKKERSRRAISSTIAAGPACRPTEAADRLVLPLNSSLKKLQTKKWHFKSPPLIDLARTLPILTTMHRVCVLYATKPSLLCRVFRRQWLTSTMLTVLRLYAMT